MTPRIEELLHRVASGRRALDAHPKGKGTTSEAVVRQFYADAVNRLARELIKEGYGE